MIRLLEIDKDNLDKVLELKVHEDQAAYVSSVAFSLAQAYVYRETAFPFAIYDDEILVGFIMMGYYEGRKQYTLWKLLIDKRYQNMGYGRAAVNLGMKKLRDMFDVSEIYTGVILGNHAAKHLYSSIGFKTTGLIKNNMEEMKYVL